MASDERDAGTPEGGAPADGDFGFTGRSGFSEGNYSGAYGRGTAGARDNPSASGTGGAGITRGGNATPAPDPADVEAQGDGSEGVGGTGRTGG
jgi:hypothetical protein